MTEATPYTVSYSQRVRDELRDLLLRAKAAGVGKEYLQAAKDMDARLKTYPQFGEPIIDLHDSGKIWVGVVGPLVVRYAIHEERRLVMVAVPIVTLPNSGV